MAEFLLFFLILTQLLVAKVLIAITCVWRRPVTVEYGEGVLRYGVRCAAYGVCTTAESHAHSFAAACLRPTTSAVVWQCHWQKQQAIMPHSSEPEPTCPGYGIRDTGHGTQTPNHTHCHTHTRIRIRRRWIAWLCKWSCGYNKSN